MALLESVVRTLHLLYGGLWTGAVVFFAWRVRPLVAEGTLGVDAAIRIVSGLRWLTRGGALVFVATGGFMAERLYTSTTLFGSPRGHAVLGMLACWLLVTGLVESGAGRMLGELGEGRLRTAGRETRRRFLAAGGLSLALLVLGGYLSA